MRADLTAVCSPCRLRFSRGHTACPRCFARPLDLRRNHDRRTVEAMVAPAAPIPAHAWIARRDAVGHLGTRVVDWLLDHSPRWFPAVLAVGGLIGVVLWCPDHPRTPEVLVLLAGALISCSLLFFLFVALGGVYATVRVLLSAIGVAMTHVNRRPDVRLTLHREPATPGAVRRGKVRLAGPPLVSPIAGQPCLAYRLRGDTTWGEIDDAGIARLVVDTDDGSVELDPVCTEVDLPCPPARPSGAALPHFPASSRPARLAEAVLLDGEEVELEGRLEEDLVADGYRGQRVVSRFVGPLRLRRARA